MSKILYITYDGLSDPIGRSQIMPYLNGLAMKGHRFWLLSFEKEMALRSFMPQLHKNITWHACRYHKWPPFISTAWDIVVGLVLGLTLIQKNSIVAVHCRSYVSAAIGVLLKKITGVKFIFDMRGFWPEEKVDAGTWKPQSVAYRVAKACERTFIRQADSIVVLTEAAKRIINSMPESAGKKCYVLPTCVDITLFKPCAENKQKIFGVPDNSFILVYFGSMGTFYDLEAMADFFQALSQHRNGRAFFLVLSNNGEEHITRTFGKKGIPKTQYCVRKEPRESLSGIVACADASIIFYRRIRSAAGCCPTKFAESLACAVPVIMNSGIGDASDIIATQKLGIVVDTPNRNTYSDAITRLDLLLGDDPALGKRCRAYAEQAFPLEKGVTHYNSIYLDTSS